MSKLENLRLNETIQVEICPKNTNNNCISSKEQQHGQNPIRLKKSPQRKYL
jgi:hypothetical protein